MNDQQQSRADALTEAVTHTIETIKRQLDLIADRAPSNFLDKRSVVQSLTAHVRRLEKALAASPVEQPALLTAQDALAAIETFEIVGDNNDSREPNAEDRFILTEFVAHLFGGFRVELPAAAPADGACKRCGSTTAQACNDAGCFYLESGDGEPSAAPADERAACTHQWTWADGKCADCGASTKQPTPTGGMTLGERIAHVGGRVKEDGIVEFGSVMALDALVQHVLRDTSAAASPAEEAVALTDEGIIQLFEEKVDVDLEVYHGIAASTVLSFARALLAAPQPAHAEAASPAAEGETEDHECVYENGDGVCRQCAELAKHHRAAASPAAERVTAALQALSADVHTLGDGWANDEAMIGLAKKYLRVEPKPASPELSLWRDFVLLAVTDAAPQPAQADAPAHAAECPHCDGEGVIEGDSGTSPCACQRDAQEGMPTFGARRAQADAPAEARERDDPELIAASNKGYAAGLRDGKALGACGPLAPADAGEAAAWRYRTSGDNWCYCDGDPVHVCDRDYEKQPLYTAPPAARVASLTNSQREAIEFAAKTMEARMLNAHACVLRALLNGADKS